MIGLDTNVLIRYLTQDDKKQAAKASRLVEETLSADEPGFVTLIAVVEIAWVLESCYGVDHDNQLVVLHELLTTRQLVIERADLVYRALKRCNDRKADFSDALITVISEENGCEKVFTFDKRASVVGMELLD